MDEGNESVGASRATMRTEEELHRFAEEIRMLSRDVGVLKANSEDKSIKFGGLGIRDLSECFEWVVKNFSSYRMLWRNVRRYSSLVMGSPTF